MPQRNFSHPSGQFLSKHKTHLYLHTMDNSTSFHELNDDILMRIFDYLHFDDKIRFRRTCVRWKFLLDEQLKLIRALRIGQFQSGGYQETCGLLMSCAQHQQVKPNHCQASTGTLFNKQLLTFPAELESQCFSISRYDYLHRSLKHSYQSVTMLSLGRLNISYRLLMVLAHNLPKLEHLELIACASERLLCGARLERQSNQPQASCAKTPHSDTHLPSLESFNNSRAQELLVISQIPYNQNPDEQVNLEQRLIRSALVRNCDLVQEARRKNMWPKLSHLLVKDCNLLNEFNLSLLLALTSHTLDQLMVESNQYLTGEFLNYCGPKLQVLQLKHCPLVQLKFIDDLRKLKQLLASPATAQASPKKSQQVITRNCNLLQPIDSFMLQIQDT